MESTQPTTYFVVINSPGQNWVKELSFREQPGIAEHVEYMRNLCKDGKLVMGGPFKDNTGGMELLTVQNIKEAEEIVKNDPAVQKKLMEATIKEWFVPLSIMK